MLHFMKLGVTMADFDLNLTPRRAVSMLLTPFAVWVCGYVSFWVYDRLDAVHDQLGLNAVADFWIAFISAASVGAVLTYFTLWALLHFGGWRNHE